MQARQASRTSPKSWDPGASGKRRAFFENIFQGRGIVGVFQKSLMPEILHQIALGEALDSFQGPADGATEEEVGALPTELQKHWVPSTRRRKWRPLPRPLCHELVDCNDKRLVCCRWHSFITAASICCALSLSCFCGGPFCPRAGAGISGLQCHLLWAPGSRTHQCCQLPCHEVIHRSALITAATGNTKRMRMHKERKPLPQPQFCQRAMFFNLMT